jgi:hypothetical protein
MKLIVDLDDTLCNIDHRKQYYGTDWKKYEELIPYDTLVQPIKEVIDTFRNTATECKVIILTGRYENCRRTTEDWLRRNEIQYDDLIMKSIKDRASSIFFKIEWLSNHNDGTLVVIDDRKEIGKWCVENDVQYIDPSQFIQRL